MPSRTNPARPEPATWEWVEQYAPAFRIAIGAAALFLALAVVLALSFAYFY